MQGRTDNQALRGYLVAITVPPALASLMAMAGAIQALPLLVPAIFLAAYLGGLRPGILAALATSVTAGHYLLADGANPAVVEVVRCGCLLVAGVTLSVLAQHVRRPEAQPAIQPVVEPVAEPVAVAAPLPMPLPEAVVVRQRTRSIPMPMMHDKATLHDLNNALAVISGNVGLLAEGFPEDHPDRELVIDIEAAVVRAAQITKTLARARQTATDAVRERRSSIPFVGAA
ncbi:MAG TPA: hypothetical protein VIU61_05510 [Kofleriaceae bacterium]